MTPDEAGFFLAGHRNQGWSGSTGSDAFAALRHLARTDLSSIWTGIPEERIYRQSDLDVPAWPAGTSPSPHSTSDRPPPAGDALAMMTSAFESADRRFGGGHAREALVAYLAGDVVDAAGRAAPGSARRALCAAAATACDLAGFMSFDSHFHGLALAYFRIAVRLAMEAADPDLYSAVLRNISLQAWTLGDTTSAARIAELALAAARRGGDRLAELLGHVAVTRAATNRQAEAREALASAEEVLTRTGIDSATVTYQRAVVLEYAGELAASQRALAVSVKQRTSSERRSRALTSARLAGLRLRTGQVDRARVAIRDLLDDHAWLASARVDAALGEVTRHLSRFRGLPSSDLLLLELRERRRHPTTFPPGGGHDDPVQA